MILLPRYIIERAGQVWVIWDTIEDEYTGFEFATKQEASQKCASINHIHESSLKLQLI
jgi:hypothetical protein